MVLKPGMVTIDRADPRALAALGPQKVLRPRVGENRVHVGFHADDREAEVRRLGGLGATVLDEQEAPGPRWTVLADPEGNEFCVAG